MTTDDMQPDYKETALCWICDAVTEKLIPQNVKFTQSHCEDCTNYADFDAKSQQRRYK